MRTADTPEFQTPQNCGWVMGRIYTEIFWFFDLWGCWEGHLCQTTSHCNAKKGKCWVDGWHLTGDCKRLYNIIYIGKGTILYVSTRAPPLNFPTGRLVTFPLAHLTPLVEWLKMYLHPWWGDGLPDRILFFNINCLSSRLEPPCPHLAWVFLSWTRKISNLLLSNSTTR